jgi:4-hydroxy-tetrahydrodipicolinate reductase
LGDVIGLGRELGIKVRNDADALFDETAADVVLHTTGSYLKQVWNQLEGILNAGLNVVSTCEELSYPAAQFPDLAQQIDELARANGVTVLATGVNPGFVMDVLPICLTGVSRRVDHVYVERVVNASTRRQPLQKKIGSGLAPDEMRRLFAEGRAGHAGFMESLHLIGHALGWRFGDAWEIFDPVVAAYDIETAFFKVSRGQCCGIHQLVVGVDETGVQRVHMDLKMYLDARDPHDTVKITGDPPLEMRVNGGVAGDHATVASLVNAIPRLLKAPAGLLLMTDLPLPALA